MTENPEVSIIIVSYNRVDVLRNTIKSLQKHIIEPEIEIILVDNASQEPVVEVVRQEFPQVRIIKNEKNLGFGGGNNIGARQAHGNYLLFVNSDIEMKSNPVPSMLTLFRKNFKVGTVGCQLINSDGTLQPSYFRFPGLLLRFLQISGLKIIINKLFPGLRFNYDSIFKLDFVSGAFFMISSKLFFEIGGFDERYFMYIEDIDLGFQVKQRGKQALLLNTRDIIHIGQHYEVIGHPFVYYHMNVGLLKFYAKNYAWWKYYILVIMSIITFSIRYLLSFLKRNVAAERRQLQEILRLYSTAFFKKSKYN